MAHVKRLVEQPFPRRLILTTHCGVPAVRVPLFDQAAPRRTVSLALNADLYARVQAAGLNVEALTERALEEALRAQEREHILKDIAIERAQLAAYVAEHGNPAEQWREAFGSWDAPAAEPEDAA
jgi:post-segregation antitoxin (ccd killing protein)